MQHVDSTLKLRENDRFHVVSTWNPRGVFVGQQSRDILEYRCSETFLKIMENLRDGQKKEKLQVSRLQ